MPIVTVPLSSTRAHSWDFMNFRSPGISFIAVVLGGSSQVEFYTRNGKMRSSAFDRLAIPHERIFHDAYRHQPAADVHLGAAVCAAGDTSERDCLGQRRRERAGENFPVAMRGDDALTVAEHALVVHHEPDHDAADAIGLLFFQRGA